MKTSIEEFDITPHQTLFPKLGQTGYTISEAISELVDNSIDARTAELNDVLEIRVELSANEIIITDNGCGMTKEEAQKSIQLGFSNKQEGDLGQFGLGLKTACTSLGKWFQIITKQKWSYQQYLIEFNEEEFVKTDGWKANIQTVEAPRELTGTSIIIRDLRFRYHKGLESKLREELMERFAPFVVNKEVKIWVNRQMITPFQPELVKDSVQKLEIKLFNETLVTGWAGILKVGSQAKSGFNMYRNNRLIRAHEKIGYTYHPSKMWITGEVHLDNIPVTHNKREFITTNEQYVDFVTKFQEAIKPLLADAQKKQRQDKIKDIPEEQRETLKDNIIKAINKVDDFKELSGDLGQDLNRRSDKEGDLSNQETREAPIKQIAVIEKEDKPEQTENKRGRKPKKTQENRVRFIRIAGEKFKFDYCWGELDENIAKLSEIDKEKRMINVTLNSNFPLLNVVRDKYTYIAILVSEGIAEAFLRANKKPMDRLIELRDETMKQFGKIVAEDVEENEYSEMEKTNKLRLVLEGAVSSPEILPLNQRDREILFMRFGIERKEMTLDEIGGQYHLTRERVRQIVDIARDKILAELG